ncbi:hypothetical protein [Legionella jordanis]|uniref:Uncharacterized protein n=1 Tax=Legionella jordanis TaxID=456 RepID=A0A0W0VE32_9GAMM|nr:hypothetical protein [Legionella jordanis]KTD18401.1 hypothetical protein Ljor_2707 [Legionella jordanis]RMX05308.1 hypothetical protein EAW55_01200 [Legionella jordanis]RMX20841.1 hypothetical protein EAS68_05845 [Legionella jordanis]VEH13253.1 Uncharacterised protein [Legionella jordanis]HAT8713604.1 hypothetical protein [Legionella jordanis]
MGLFFRRQIAAHHKLLEALNGETLTQAFVDLLNSFGMEPALQTALQSRPGFLLETLLSQNKFAFVQEFLQCEKINNRHQFITIDVYKKILSSQNHTLINLCRETLKVCPSQKHKALVLYPLMTEILNRVLDHDKTLHNKVMKGWQRVNLDELLALNLFLQLGPEGHQLEHYFKGGLFAVKDGGRLKQFFQANMKSKDRSHDCSHPSISPVHSNQGQFIPEFLFGDRNIDFIQGKQIYNRLNKLQKAVELTEDSYTWFQAEYASLFGESMLERIKNYLTHKLCFIIYWLTSKNVGPYGLSEYKENNVAILRGIEPEDESAPFYSVAIDESGFEHTFPFISFK